MSDINERLQLATGVAHQLTGAAVEITDLYLGADVGQAVVIGLAGDGTALDQAMEAIGAGGIISASRQGHRITAAVEVTVLGDPVRFVVRYDARVTS